MFRISGIQLSHQKAFAEFPWGFIFYLKILEFYSTILQNLVYIFNLIFIHYFRNFVRKQQESLISIDFDLKIRLPI